MDKYEKELIKFLIRRIQHVGGSIPFQHITGHLSQVRNEVRTALGTSKSDLLEFLMKHKDKFQIDKSNVVTLVDCSQDDWSDSESSSIDHKASLPKYIENGSGVIVKLLPSYGFIKSKEPLKTNVFFKAQSFTSDKEANLTEYGLNVGTMVYFRAFKQNKDGFTSNYVATNVWKMDNVDEDYNIIQKSRKNRDSGLYDPVNLDGEGVIQKVFPNLGFIAANGDENNTVFFYKSRVANYNNIVDLTQVFIKGDLVEFSAHRSTKPDTKARWEAIKVWKKSGKIVNVKKNEKVSSCKSDSGISNKSSSQSRSVQDAVPSVMDVKHKSSVREMIKNQSGKICPRSNGAVIKFGEKFTELADGDSSVYYICGTQVTEISWEFLEGDNVQFDAVKIKSAPGWKAVLVWVGKKPDIVLPTCLGDFSEFTDEEELEEISESNSETSASGNYLPISSNSSMKSMSKSESSAFKSSSWKEKLKFDKPNGKGYNMKDVDASSRYGSQSSISSKESKIHQKSRKNTEKKTSIKELTNAECISDINSRDTYPVEESQGKSSKQISDFLATELSQSCVTFIQDDELESMTEYLNISVGKDSPHKNITTSSTDNEHSKPVEVPTIRSDRKAVETSLKSRLSCVKKQAGIKKIQNVKGKAIKVYSTFAEVESPKLQKPVGFFWKIFYSNKVSVEELELDNLRQVLEVGDNVCFNYFEIIDDSGQLWQKVTLVWSGSKPVRFNEMTPYDFIKQNDLSVTVENDSSVHNIEKEVTSNKYLTAFDDVSPDKIGGNISRTESCSDDETYSLKQSKISNIQVKTLPASQFQVLSSIINEKMLKNKHLFLRESKADLTTLSAEIVNIVLEQCNEEKADNPLIESLAKENHEKQIPVVICSSCRRKLTEDFSSESKNTKDTEMQTIFTGDVMAQNIYPEC